MVVRLPMKSKTVLVLNGKVISRRPIDVCDRDLIFRGLRPFPTQQTSKKCSFDCCLYIHYVPEASATDLVNSITEWGWWVLFIFSRSTKQVWGIHLERANEGSRALKRSTEFCLKCSSSKSPSVCNEVTEEPSLNNITHRSVKAPKQFVPLQNPP